MQTLKERYAIKRLKKSQKQLASERVKVLQEHITAVEKSLLVEGGPDEQTLKSAMALLKNLDKVAAAAEVGAISDAVKKIRAQINQKFSETGGVKDFVRDLWNQVKKSAGVGESFEHNPIGYGLTFMKSIVSGFNKLNDVVEMQGTSEKKPAAEKTTTEPTAAPTAQTEGDGALTEAPPKPEDVDKYEQGLLKKGEKQTQQTRIQQADQTASAAAKEADKQAAAKMGKKVAPTDTRTGVEKWEEDQQAKGEKSAAGTEQATTKQASTDFPEGSIGAALISANPKYKGNTGVIIDKLFDLGQFKELVNKDEFAKEILNIDINKVPQIHQAFANMQNDIDTAAKSLAPAAATQQPAAAEGGGEQGGPIDINDENVQQQTNKLATQISHQLINNQMGLKFPDTMAKDIKDFILNAVTNKKQAAVAQPVAQGQTKKGAVKKGAPATTATP